MHRSLTYVKLFKHFTKGNEVLIMSRVCQMTGKRPLSGNKRSHSLMASRRRWNVNLQKYTIEQDGKKITVRLSARAIRTLNKSK